MLGSPPGDSLSRLCSTLTHWAACLQIDPQRRALATAQKMGSAAMAQKHRSAEEKCSQERVAGAISLAAEDFLLRVSKLGSAVSSHTRNGGNLQRSIPQVSAPNITF